MKIKQLRYLHDEYHAVTARILEMYNEADKYKLPSYDDNGKPMPHIVSIRQLTDYRDSLKEGMAKIVIAG